MTVLHSDCISTSSPSPASEPCLREALPAYLPELDGCRAVAIGLVFLFHLSIRGCMLGWSGVWLFYVLSGFLITGILVDAKKQTHFFRNFYVRRALRIFPVYYLCFVGLLLLGWSRNLPVGDWYWYLCYMQNYVLGANQFNEAFPYFGHTWSLAVEEQFYLLWPFAVYVLSQRSLVVFALILIAIAPLARLFVIARYGLPYMVYTPLICVMDAMATGALLALLLRSRPEIYFRLRHDPVIARGLWAGLIGCLAVIGIVVIRHGFRRYWHPEGYLSEVSVNVLLHSLLSLTFVLGLALALSGNRYLSRVLCHPLLRHIGKISYGLYLYHIPIFVLMTHLKLYDVHGLTGSRIFPLAATYLVAWLSWRFFESPLLALKSRFTS